jgi:steroid delta-isomerase-like uncharacterized protein
LAVSELEGELDGEAVVMKLFSAMNSAESDEIAALAHEDVKFVDVPGGEEVKGREQWKAYWGRYLKAFPDLELEVTNIVAAGDSVTVEGARRGTHKGDLESPAGSIPATKKPIDVPFCLVVRVSDGLIVDAREYYDAVTMLLQLGIMPEPVAADG